MPSERKSPDLLEQVATIYADVEPDQTASQAPLSGALEQSSSNLKGASGSTSPRKRKKGSRKGKERAVDVNEEDAMDTT